MNIKDILSLDSKRTQGEWFNKSFNCYCDIVESSGDDAPDAQFIAAAPRMAEIIKEQQEALKEAYKLLSIIKDYDDMGDMSALKCLVDIRNMAEKQLKKHGRKTT